MLSLRSIPSQSATALARYYEGLSQRPDGYYQGGAGLYEPSGVWQGGGALSLRLKGAEIAEGELLRAMQGLHPRTGIALSGTQENGHKPGWDLTFSAPKSVSAAWAIADPELRANIEAAHQHAVIRALAYLERDAIVVRIRTDQNTVTRESVANHGGALFATYEHSSSRSSDPQLHTHAVLMNMTPAGRSLDFSAAHVHAGGAIYRSELAYQLHALGFAVERDGKSFRLSGTPELLVEEWSKRRAQIEMEASKHGVHTAAGMETVTLATRTGKEAKPRADLFLQWSGEALEYEYDAAAVRQQATLGVTQKLENAPEVGLLSSLTETHATVSREQALAEMAARSYGLDDATLLEQRLDRALQKQAVILQSPEIKSEWHRAGARYTTQEMLDLERHLIERCERLAADREKFHLPAAVRRAAMQNASLSEEQRRAFNHTIDGGRVAAIQGAAGTGKSTLLATVSEAYDAENYRVIGTALSQRATRGLEEASGIPSRNVAQLLHDLDSGQEHIDAHTVLVVDEVGMIGTRSLETITRWAEVSGTKVILVGDGRQLQAIEAGGAYRGIQERIGYAELVDNRRQQLQADRDIALAFREGRAADGLEILQKHGRLYLNKDREAVKQTAVLAYLQDMDAGKSALLLAKDRQAVHELNESVRAELRADGILGEVETTVNTRNGYRNFAEDDRVVLGLGAKQQFYDQLEPQDRELAHNGATGTVERVTSDRVVIQLDSGPQIELDTSTHTNSEGNDHRWAVNHAYATTAHKAQGMTVDRAHIVVSGEEQREWVYVALSRHRETVHVYATNEALGTDAHSIERTNAARTLSHAESKDLALDYQIGSVQEAHELEGF